MPRLPAASWLLLCSLAANALAAPRQAIGLVVLTSGVAPSDRDTITADRVRRAALRAFRRDAAANVVDPFKALSDRFLTLKPEAKQSLERGVNALGQRQYRRAIQLLERADQLAHDSLSDVPKGALAEIAIHMAAAQQGAGRRDEAYRALCRLLAWRPRHNLLLRVPPPPGWEGTVRRARRWLKAPPTGDLKVESTSPGASVYIDGRRAGLTPRLLGGIVVGPHYLTLRQNGYRRSMVRVEVQPGDNEVTIPLAPDEPAHTIWQSLLRLRPQLGRDGLTLPADLTTQLGLSALLLVRVKVGDSTMVADGFLYRLKDGRLVRRTSLTLPGRPRSEQLQTLALWRDHIPPATPRLDRRDGPRWYERWWVWGAVGVACAVAVALPVALTAGGGEESTPTERYRVSW